MSHSPPPLFFGRSRKSLKPPSNTPSPPIRDGLASESSITPVSPDNSPSLSNIYPLASIGYGSGLMAYSASAGFEGVKTTLRLIENATDVSPPLKLTVTGLLTLIHIMEVRDF